MSGESRDVSSADTTNVERADTRPGGVHSSFTRGAQGGYESCSNPSLGVSREGLLICYRGVHGGFINPFLGCPGGFTNPALRLFKAPPSQKTCKMEQDPMELWCLVETIGLK